jgi:putative molybdopterin biosynthesis protein
VTQIQVTALPKVVLIPTGSELVPFDALKTGELKTGDTLEYNTVVLAGLVKKLGALPINHSIIPDNFETLKKVIKSSIESDAHMVVINAGSSAGSEDYTAAAIRELGEVLVHGIAMMPGKPTILGIIDGKPVIGNPGYPVSAILSFEVFGIPVLETMLGLPHRMRSTMSAITARKIPSKLGTEEFFRVKLGKVGNKVIAAPLPRGAGSITTLTKADGILRIPAKSEGIDHGSDVTIELLRPAFEIDRTLVAIGSHDLTIDILGDELRGDNIYLTSSHVGSLGGLLALKNHTAHFATSHLMDTETGIYNWSYIKKYIPDVPVRMFNGVMREQGFMVLKGNPKKINSFSDLTRDDVKFINRQSGSGTRVLLDYYLDKEGINSDHIIGYDLEEYTHTSVAVAVLSGVADVGMGVLAAAQALGLDFIPIAVEEYDLVIPEEYVSDEKIVRMLEVLGSSSFKARVSALGGYGVQRSGEEIKL